MGVDIDRWMKDYLQAVRAQFGNRLLFVGLQGSYGRNEATDSSDIDVVLILDRVTAGDLRIYDETISKLPHREKVCGFISGRKELLNWDKADLFQFCHDTTPVLGNLDDLLPMIRRADVRRAILFGACNIYHLCGHNIVHEKNPEILKSLCKSAFFVMQALQYERTGIYIKTLQELLPLLPPGEQQILQAYMNFKEQCLARNADFDPLSECLFNWAGQLIQEYGDDCSRAESATVPES